MNYTVTIGIPVYNVEPYIRRTLESALQQSYPYIEFLLVDDGSSDHSIDIVRELQKSHSRGSDVRVLCHERNLGVSAARNLIIDEAQGDYLYFMDSDDTIRMDTISLMLENIRRYDADVVFGSYQKISEGRVVGCYQYPDAQFLQPDALGEYSYRRYAGIQASACNFLVKTSVLRENHLRFYPVNFWEDMIFTLDLVSLPLRAVMLSEFTYRYIQREGSLSQRSSFNKQEILNNFSAIEYLKQGCRQYKGKPFYPGRCYVAVMTDFYIICNLLKNRDSIMPAISDAELMSYMTHPASLLEILRFRQQRIPNLFLWLICRLPSSLGILIIRILGKQKGLI